MMNIMTIFPYRHRQHSQRTHRRHLGQTFLLVTCTLPGTALAGYVALRECGGHLPTHVTSQSPVVGAASEPA